MRRALALAIEQGQGRAAAVLHNNLAFAELAVRRAAGGARGLQGRDRLLRAARIAEFALAIAAMSTTFLAERGLAEQALGRGRRRWPSAWKRAAPSTSIEPRSVQLRLLAERGAHEQAPAADELRRDGP